MEKVYMVQAVMWYSLDLRGIFSSKELAEDAINVILSTEPQFLVQSDKRIREGTERYAKLLTTDRKIVEKNWYWTKLTPEEYCKIFLITIIEIPIDKSILVSLYAE
jgi:hypothetical protein